MSRPYNQQDADFSHVKGADQLPDATGALRRYQRSLGVPVSQDHPERRDGPRGRRKGLPRVLAGVGHTLGIRQP